MLPSFVQATLLALSSVPVTVAFDKLAFPFTVVANTSAQFQITNDLSTGAGSFDNLYDSFRVYLSITVPGFGAAPSCYLVNSSAINTTDLTFPIPPSVGPDDSSYSIATMEFNKSPYADGPSGFEYSNNFILTNATGEYSAAELAGQSLADPNNVPCSAYNCARNCTQSFYPANVNNTDAFKSTYECTAACPGVTYKSYAALLAEECASPNVNSTLTSACAAATQSPTSTTSSTSTASTTSIDTASTTGKSASASTSKPSTPSQSASAGCRTSRAGVTMLSTVFLGVLSLISL